MKLTFRQIEPFVQNPDPAMRVILIYGPDAGLMKERSKIIASKFVEDINDPFNTATLNGANLHEDPARLSDEANAVSMMGGMRLVRVEDADDKLTAFIKDYLTDPNDNAIIILQASDLGPRSKLRLLCEKDPNAAALPCYVEDERGLTRLIREIIQNAGQHIEPDAVTWLSINISGDRAKVRMEMDKLILYKTDGNGSITLHDAKAACGEAGAQSMDDLVYAVASGKTGDAFRAYQLLMEDGVAFIVVLRALQTHFRKLHLTLARMQDGLMLDKAVDMLQPKIFFKYAPMFKAQAGQWSLEALDSVMAKLSSLEADCKKTGAPVDTLCSQAILALSKAPRRIAARAA